MNVLITHVDLDGIGAAVVAEAQQHVGQVIHTDYNTVDADIAAALQRSDVETLFIVDISPQSQAAIDSIDHAGIEVKVYDHHETAEKLLAGKPWVTIDTTRCGTKIFAEEEAITEGYEDFIYHVNDYDLWIHESPKSKDLNMLLWLLGREEFIKRFVANPSMEFTDEEQVKLAIYKQRRDEAVDEAIAKAAFVEDNLHRKVAVVRTGSYISQVADVIQDKYPWLDYVVILDLDKEKASLRSRSVDVQEIAELYGGGGHKYAAGFSMPAAGLIDRFINKPRRLKKNG